LLACLIVAVSVIENELVVLDVLSYTVYFDLRLMNPDFGVTTRYRVDFSKQGFFFKQWSLTYTNADVHLGASNVVKSLVN